MSLVIRNVRPFGGPLVDVAINDGVIVAIGPGIEVAGEECDGRGHVLLPGLHDRHLHILALAARRHSVDLAGVLDPAEVAARLRASSEPFVRATGYDERTAGLPDTAMLDGWIPDRPLRIQDRTGALWVLNSAALAMLAGPLPKGAERDSKGRLTGRFWREDQWLGSAVPRAELSLDQLGAEFSSYGLTALTDASAHNGPGEAVTLAGSLPQRLTLMGSNALEAGNGYVLGPLKLLFDERDPPPLDETAERVRIARQAGRAIAAHCVTTAELALYLAVLDAAGGSRKGDRIEHGGQIPDEFIGPIAQAGLQVVTNPAFLHDRGDRYRSEIAEDDWRYLYRIAALQGAGIAVRAGSDAPYASVDPWLGMRSARDRLTRGGCLLGPAERIDAAAALQLYTGGAIAAGAPADLIICEGSSAEVLFDLTAERVRMTIIAGDPVYVRD